MKKNSTNIMTDPDTGLFEAAGGEPGKPPIKPPPEKKPPIKEPPTKKPPIGDPHRQKKIRVAS
jgi:hypothetical protein